MDNQYFWWVTLFLALGTFSIRFSIIALSSKIEISKSVKELFTFIPAAILPAIAAPMVFFHQGQIKSVFEKERFIIIILATAVCYVSRSMIATIVFGLLALYFSIYFLSS